jgi:UDP-N-acetylmuramyl pentapeptide synthase
VRAPRADFSEDYRINLVGRHQVTNALLAAAVGAELGLEPELVRQGLEQCRPPSGRMQIARSGGICVVNDAYNANPDSMRAALEALRELPCQGRRIAVLGEMAELGPAAEAAHRDIGRLVAESGVSTLYAVGRMGAWMAEGARAAGLEEIERFEDVAGVAGRLRSRLHAGDVVLVKASRSARFERVTAALMGASGG